MGDKIFTLLSMEPVLSIVLGFLLAGFLAYVFRGVITAYVKKHYNLYSEEEIRSAGIQKANTTLKTMAVKEQLVDFTEYIITILKENKDASKN